MQDVKVRVRLRELPPLPRGEGPTDVGLQDKAGALVTAEPIRGGGLAAETQILLVPRADAVDFCGPFVHGRPGERFLYLNWKRRTAEASPWLQRVKIPLAGIRPAIAQAAASGAGVLEANVTGRRPHDTAPVVWSLRPA